VSPFEPAARIAVLLTTTLGPRQRPEPDVIPVDLSGDSFHDFVVSLTSSLAFAGGRGRGGRYRLVRIGHAALPTLAAASEAGLPDAFANSQSVDAQPLQHLCGGIGPFTVDDREQ
jgi:hypothetical protein